METMNSAVDRARQDLSDQEIITGILAGDKELFARLIRKYNGRMYRVCMSILKSDGEAEDVMQVAYIRAYENLEKFEFKSSFSTWLTRILINESLQRLNKMKKTISMKEDAENAGMHGGEVQTPLKKLVNSELKSALEAAILQLPEKYRTVFVMREIEHLNVVETGECLGISGVNVKVRLNRAKALLRNALSKLYSPDEILQFHLSRCDRVVNYVMERI